jgi:hypothetical protein
LPTPNSKTSENTQKAKRALPDLNLAKICLMAKEKSKQKCKNSFKVNQSSKLIKNRIKEMAKKLK